MLRVVDKEGNLCPSDQRKIRFSVKGEGSFRAVANGDPTNLEPFHQPCMHLFNGMLTVIVQSSEEAGALSLRVAAKGVKAGTIVFRTETPECLF